MTGLKSSYEIALEKMKDMDIKEAKQLNEDEKQIISDIKNEYEAKIAEKKILLAGQPELTAEISFLERKRDQKINEFYENIDR